MANPGSPCASVMLRRASVKQIIDRATTNLVLDDNLLEAVDEPIATLLRKLLLAVLLRARPSQRCIFGPAPAAKETHLELVSLLPRLVLVLVRDLRLELLDELLALLLRGVSASARGGVRAVLVGRVLALLALVGGVRDAVSRLLRLRLDVRLDLLRLVLRGLLLGGEARVGDGLVVRANLTVGSDPLKRKGLGSIK